MQACTQWTHSDAWSQLPTTPECLFKIGDRESEKKLRNCNGRAICNATRGIDAGRGVIRHRGVPDGSDGARPLWRSHSARTDMFFADEIHFADVVEVYYQIHSEEITPQILNKQEDLLKNTDHADRQLIAFKDCLESRTSHLILLPKESAWW